jgi:hypothetical protein
MLGLRDEYMLEELHHMRLREAEERRRRLAAAMHRPAPAPMAWLGRRLVALGARLDPHCVVVYEVRDEALAN